MIYLDNNGTTPLLPEVLEAMLPYFIERFGNSSAMHAGGRRAKAALKQARNSVANFLCCRPTEIIFTSGGTEGDNLALKGMVSAGDHIVTSAIEHSAIWQTCLFLRHVGCEVTRVGVNRDGVVDPEEVRNALRSNTKLISIMMANNETGVLQPVEEIGRIAREADIWFHTDAVQAAGKVPIDVNQIGCDLLTITAHKIHGPQGTGALYVRRGTPLSPQIHGGHQESSRRPGTENIAGIVGLATACEIAQRGFEDGSVLRLGEWRNKLEAAVLTQIPEAGVNGQKAPRVANTSNIYFDHVGGDALVLALDELSIAASRGAACNAGEVEPSSILMAMGLSGERSRSSVRFSLGKTNTEQDVDRVIAVLPDVVRDLRQKCGFAQAEPAATAQQ
ncbi:MAG TPA: cysteine desulfurase family protein [Candidatus Acidoferrales bacterium]|nr:cysteine desulfurase family protein [Candidatus Acidoferrales bacterium]